jgi:hypothetical protein
MCMSLFCSYLPMVLLGNITTLVPSPIICSVTSSNRHYLFHFIEFRTGVSFVGKVIKFWSGNIPYTSKFPPRAAMHCRSRVPRSSVKVRGLFQKKWHFFDLSYLRKYLKDQAKNLAIFREYPPVLMCANYCGDTLRYTALTMTHVQQSLTFWFQKQVFSENIFPLQADLTLLDNFMLLEARLPLSTSGVSLMNLRSTIREIRFFNKDTRENRFYEKHQLLLYFHMCHRKSHVSQRILTIFCTQTQTDTLNMATFLAWSTKYEYLKSAISFETTLVLLQTSGGPDFGNALPPVAEILKCKVCFLTKI